MNKIPFYFGPEMVILWYIICTVEWINLMENFYILNSGTTRWIDGTVLLLLLMMMMCPVLYVLFAGSE